MKALIVEDDMTSRLMLLEWLNPLGLIHTAVNGLEAYDSYEISVDANDPYDFICLDIMSPELNGQQVLRKIRQVEAVKGIKPGRGVKILMTTALSDSENMTEAFRQMCDGYLIKPISKDKLLYQLQQLQLI